MCCGHRGKGANTMAFKFKAILKRILIAVGALFILLVALTAWTMFDSNRRAAEREEYYRLHKDEIEAQREAEFMELGFSVEDSSEDLVVDTYSDLFSGKELYVYDSAYLDKYFEYPSIDVEEVKQTLAANQKIPEKYKETISYFIDRVHELYPSTDLRPFELNLRTLEVVEVDEWDMSTTTLSLAAYACYVRTENRIYLPQDTTFEPGTWEWQVIIHELSHALRSVDHDEVEDDRGIHFRYLLSSPDYSNEIAAEALNSLFAVSLLEYEERDIAYQLQSNMVDVMLDCMDNYSLADYPNHSYSYFLSKLDETNGDHNYAASIFKLMEAQRKDWQEERWDRPQSTYYPLYHYVCKMWLDANARAGMTETELEALVAELLERVMYDVPEEYHIDTDEFSRYAQSYYEERFGALGQE